MNDARDAAATAPEQLRAEVAELRCEIERLADAVSGARLLPRYALTSSPEQPLSPYRRFRVWLGRTLRHLRLWPWPPAPPWPGAMKHADRDEYASTLLVWDIGTKRTAGGERAADADRSYMRAALQGYQHHLAGRRHLAPVLVTDVADFAFYSRLHWLVEYVPALRSPAEAYAQRKLGYLAWRYRNAPALPLNAGLLDTADFDRLLDSVLMENAG